MTNHSDTQTSTYIQNGVTFIDPSSNYIDISVTIGAGTIIYPMVCLYGSTKIGTNCKIYPFSDLTNTTVGNHTEVRSTYATDTTIGANCTVGPFTCLRAGAIIADNCRVGDFVEIKNSTLSKGVKVAHLSYIGDSSVGAETNVGCGTVFANYNGKTKQKISVGSNVFIGCNTNLIAPLEIGDNTFIAGGSTITESIPPHSFSKSRTPQIVYKNKNL